jgi:hypothetical protein
MILTIREKVTPEQLKAVLEMHSNVNYVKVDIEQGFLAGGGDMHSDCEEILLEHECEQHNIWGAGWHWDTQEVKFDSLINIRPKQGNRGIELTDPNLRKRITEIILEFFEGVQP